ncbi:M66 family metalloprotease [Aestuariivirga sp.]|uniref:M66 family metalloprotease n=1 Tax=Aestuariivirga sp. TaxID=2650926 RepID=UPI00359314AE
MNVEAGWNGGTAGINDYTYQTFIHEILHTMGLGHAGNYNGRANFVTDTADVNCGNTSNIFLNDS